METTDLLERVYDELARKYRAHTILLYGSRADGSSNEFSDYDVAAFAPVESTIRDTRVVNGQFLDVFVHPEEMLAHPCEDHLTLRSSKIIAQRGREATEFVAQLEAIFNLGPKRLAEDEILARRNWAWKMASRMQREDVEGNYRRSWLLTILLEDYFHIRQMWYQGPKKSLQWLKASDEPTYRAFERALKPGASQPQIHALLVHVVGAAQRGETLQ